MSTINIRSKRLKDKTELRVLIAYNTDYPKHYIRLLTITWNKKVILTAELAEHTPKNPFFAFVLKQTNAGDKITVSWLDNIGNSETEKHIVR